jgi:hypothetical protein
LFEHFIPPALDWQEKPSRLHVAPWGSPLDNGEATSSLGQRKVASCAPAATSNADSLEGSHSPLAARSRAACGLGECRSGVKSVMSQRSSAASSFEAGRWMQWMLPDGDRNCLSSFPASATLRVAQTRVARFSQQSPLFLSLPGDHGHGSIPGCHSSIRRPCRRHRAGS